MNVAATKPEPVATPVPKSNSLRFCTIVILGALLPIIALFVGIYSTTHGTSIDGHAGMSELDMMGLLQSAESLLSHYAVRILSLISPLHSENGELVDWSTADAKVMKGDKSSFGAPPPLTSAIKKPKPTAPAESPEAPAAVLHCYTLEEYSATFLKTKPAAPLFSCGTRVVDLRTEDHPIVRTVCGSTPNTESRFPTLRVVLTATEVEWHRRLQPTNTVSQRIRLDRVNDDYCDCLDGTDELLSNACSMSGPLSPLAGGRWKSYLISTQSLQLYENSDVVVVQDQEAHGLESRKTGDVEDRLYVLGGPVLPFLCNCSGVPVLLSPSLVGDGIVDCCEAEDEAVLQGHPYTGQGASLAETEAMSAPGSLQAKALSRERAQMMEQWKRLQRSAARHSNDDDGSDPSLKEVAKQYADLLFPTHTSARAVLIEKGYYSLFSSDVVRAARQRAALKMLKLHRDGHIIQQQRSLLGWERLGQGLLANRTNASIQLSNLTAEIAERRKSIQYRMQMAQVQNKQRFQIEDFQRAGVSIEELEVLERMSLAQQLIQTNIQHTTIATVHNAFGDHFEYYPVLEGDMYIPSSQVVDTRNQGPSAPSAGPLYDDRKKRTMTILDIVQRSSESQEHKPPQLHVDNITVDFYGLRITRVISVAQHVDAESMEYVAHQLGLRHSSSTVPLDPAELAAISDPFERSPVLDFGFWQPYSTVRNGGPLHVADPAGDVDLPRRAFVHPTSTLYRGGGRLQWPTRRPENPRELLIPDEQESNMKAKEKMKAASAEKGTTGGKQIKIPFHTNTPNILAVEFYIGEVVCDLDTPLAGSPWSADDDGDGHDATGRRSAEARQRPHKMVHMFTTYVCDTKDRIVFWGKDGKCRSEVVIGTPSACTSWALRNAEVQLHSVGGSDLL